VPDFEIEVVGNETATATLAENSNLDLEITIGSTSMVASIPSPEAEVHITPEPYFGGDPTAVKNRGNAPGLMVLDMASPVPPGTPAGTVILRTP